MSGKMSAHRQSCPILRVPVQEGRMRALDLTFELMGEFQEGCDRDSVFV